MELRQLDITDKEAFNSFIAAHPSGSFLQSWDWGDWQEQLDYNALRFFIKEGEQILLSAQVIQTVIPHLNKHYLYIPYGPLVFVDANQSQIISYFIDGLKKHYPQNLFIRTEPKDDLGITGKTTVRIQPGKTLVLDLTKPDEQLLTEMHPKTRYNIKVAQRHEVQVISEPVITPGHGLRLQEVLDLLITTSQRQNFKSHGPSYYKKLIDFFGRHPGEACTLTVYKTLYQQELVATALMVDFGHIRTYLFGGTSDTKKNVMAPYALHWQAIQDAKNRSLTQYDFWGIETASGKVPGFARFKLGWGGTTINYPPVIDIIQHPAWYTIYNALRSLNRTFQ